MRKLLDSGMFGVLTQAANVLPSYSKLEQVLVGLKEVDDFLDTVRPVIIRLSSFPLLKYWKPIRVLADALQKIEKVLDSIPSLED